MDQRSLEKLEFTQVRELLASYAQCELGKRLAEHIQPVRGKTTVKRWLDQFRQMQRAASAIGAPPFAGVQDIRQLVRKAVPPAKLEPEQLARIRETLAATPCLRAWLDSLPEGCDELGAFLERIGDLDPIARQIDEAIDPRAKVRDEASARLQKIRSTIRMAREHIETVIDRLLKSPHTLRMLQYPRATFHNDRMVLPLKAEHRGRLPGIIHRSSDSGATLFVEPTEAVELNNTIITLRQQEHEEIGRILWYLTQLIHLNADQILKTLDALAVLDLIGAKIRLAESYSMNCPEINDDGIIRLRGARHPLLLKMRQEDIEAGREPREVIPIDVRLGDDFDMLVVTGPNTGGKTVALKTVGLLALMTQAGLAVPAEEGSALPVFDDVMIDVGDEQSLQQSLSTFSSHMSQILRMLGRAKRSTLILIDELGAGTDPHEGAAIGRALMDELLRIGAPTIITTHIGALKSVGFSRKRADNGAVEFDVTSLRPLYKLRIGEPGNSNAIAIARRLGMSGKLVRTAERYISDREHALQRAIAGTIESRRRAEQVRDAAERAKITAERERSTYEQRAAELRARQEQFETWVSKIAMLRPGDHVHIRRFDRDGIVVRMRLHKQLAVVSVGAVEMEVPIAELQPVLRSDRQDASKPNGQINDSQNTEGGLH